VVSLPQARLIGLLSAILLLAGQAVAAPLRVVAAENVYGDIAAQIGGDAVSVTSVLSRMSSRLRRRSPAQSRMPTW
jgi:zinc/manganese transport system substrate-binding protein